VLHERAYSRNYIMSCSQSTFFVPRKEKYRQINQSVVATFDHVTCRSAYGRISFYFLISTATVPVVSIEACVHEIRLEVYFVGGAENRFM
jgi:hypothetical protein